MSKDKDPVLWAVFGGEELPRALVVARTPDGAKRLYEKRTGESRYDVHVEEVKFNKGIYTFISEIC